jgi:hypothetical protein
VSVEGKIASVGERKIDKFLLENLKEDTILAIYT